MPKANTIPFDLGYIIDDNKLSCVTNTQILEKSYKGLQIKKFTRPLFGLAHLKRDLILGRKILLLLDIEMPKLSGPQLLRYLLQQDYLNTSNLNVIFISSTIENYLFNPIMNNHIVADKIKKPLSLKMFERVLEKNFEQVSVKIAESA